MNLKFLDDFLLTSVFNKMSCSVFIRMCRTSRKIYATIQRNRKCIKIPPLQHELQIVTAINHEIDPVTHVDICIKHSNGKFCKENTCKIDEMSKEMAELSYFQFGAIELIHTEKLPILQSLKKERLACYKLIVEADYFLNQTLHQLKPKELIISDLGNFNPVDLIGQNYVNLSNLEKVKLYPDEAQFNDCVTHLARNCRSFTVNANHVTLRNPVETMETVKKMVQDLQSALILNQEFCLLSNIRSSVQFRDLLRVFRDIRHSSWKQFSRFGFSLDSHAFLFVETSQPNQTLVIFLKEELLSARGKGLIFRYKLISNLKEFLSFYGVCSFYGRDFDVEKEFSSKKKKKQLKFVKKTYFTKEL